MKRSPMRRRPNRKGRVPEQVKWDVRMRAGGCCEAQTQVCTFRAVHLHHRLMRSQGGQHTADNLIAVCRNCHDRIHAHPAEAYAHGWLIRSHTDQAEDTE